jgi:UDP-N-acetylglucosamine 1-carboxyvinyltransferase
LAGLAAEGRTSITNLYQLDRGHTNLVERFAGLGAEIERL